MASTLVVLTLSLMIFRGRSSKLGVRSGAGRLGGFIVPRVIFGVADLGVGEAAGFTVAADAIVEAALEAA